MPVVLFLLYFLLSILATTIFSSPHDNDDMNFYDLLGVLPSASQKEIKKAYHKLAKRLHPDSRRKEENFTDDHFVLIAHAYEVLSNAETRASYDMNLARHERDSRRNDGRKKFEMDEDFFVSDDDYYEPEYFHPIIAGSVVNSGNVILPYTPILTSNDRSSFAFLDNFCSFGVYTGSIDNFLHYLMFGKTDLTDLPVEMRFRTDPKPSFRGNCFAVLDETGVFRIMHSNYEQRNVLWSSSQFPDIDYFSPFAQRFYLELFKGEIQIQMVTVGHDGVKCVWSSGSCDKFNNLIVSNCIGTLKKLLSEFSKITFSIQTLVTKHCKVCRIIIGKIQKLLESLLNK